MLTQVRTKTVVGEGGGGEMGIYDQQHGVWTVPGNEDSQQGRSPKRSCRLRVSAAWCLISPPTHRDTSLFFYSALGYFPLTEIPVLLNIALQECEFAQVGQFA